MKNSPEFKYYRRHSISYFIFGIIIEAISLLVIMAMGEEAKKDSTSIFISVAAILALLASIYYLVVAIIIYKTPKDKVNEVVLNNKVENLLTKAFRGDIMNRYLLLHIKTLMRIKR